MAVDERNPFSVIPGGAAGGEAPIQEGELEIELEDPIKKYLPDIEEDMLFPSYAGLRPMTSKEDKTKRDFTISTFDDHKIKNLINIFTKNIKYL